MADRCTGTLKIDKIHSEVILEDATGLPPAGCVAFPASAQSAHAQLDSPGLCGASLSPPGPRPIAMPKQRHHNYDAEAAAAHPSTHLPHPPELLQQPLPLLAAGPVAHVVVKLHFSDLAVLHDGFLLCDPVQKHRRPWSTARREPAPAARAPQQLTFQGWHPQIVCAEEGAAASSREWQLLDGLTNTST